MALNKVEIYQKNLTLSWLGATLKYPLEGALHLIVFSFYKMLILTHLTLRDIFKKHGSILALNKQHRK